MLHISDSCILINSVSPNLVKQVSGQHLSFQQVMNDIQGFKFSFLLF
jgi:hypothetical protein